MPSPPETDRQYAQFMANGMGDPSEITQLLGMEPNESWSVGDKYERRGHAFKRRGSMWLLKSGVGDNLSLEVHIEALLKKLEPHRNALLDIGTRYQIKISCVAYVYQSFGLELPFDLQRSATELGVGFSFSGYSFGDFHEEIVELREQLDVRGDG